MALPGTGSTNQAQTISAFKKLAGKANTSTLREFYEETIPSNIQVKTDSIFAEDIPQAVSADTSDLYTRYSASVGKPQTVEFVEFTIESVLGTDYDANTGSFGTTGFGGGDEAQSSGFHGYQLKLHGDYNVSSSNPVSGTAPFSSSQVVHETNGELQLVSPSFGPQSGNNYTIQLYTSKGGTRIFPTDPIDWVMDYFNGVLFIQDYNAAKVPTYAVGYIYTGKMASTAITDASGSGGGSSIVVKDEGSNISTAASSFDFVGSGVTATNSSNDITVTIPGGIDYGRTVASASLTASVSDRIIGVTSTGSLEIKLAPAQTLTAGQYVTIKKEVNSNNLVTISTSGSQTIDGVTSVVLESPHAAINLYSNGSSAYFIY